MSGYLGLFHAVPTLSVESPVMMTPIYYELIVCVFVIHSKYRRPGILEESGDRPDPISNKRYWNNLEKKKKVQCLPHRGNHH